MSEILASLKKLGGSNISAEGTLISYGFLTGGGTTSASVVVNKGRYLLVGGSSYGRNSNCTQCMSWSWSPDEGVEATALAPWSYSSASGSYVWDVNIPTDSTTISVYYRLTGSGNYQYTNQGFYYVIKYSD